MVNVVKEWPLSLFLDYFIYISNSRCVVWTGDNRCFCYNPSTKTSVWERPPDLIGRADVTEMMKSPAAAEKFKAQTAAKAAGENAGKNKKSSADSDNDAPVAKKKKVELVFEDELKANEQVANGGGKLLLYL